jgi:YVTN family beta-propeller protein
MAILIRLLAMVLVFLVVEGSPVVTAKSQLNRSGAMHKLEAADISRRTGTNIQPNLMVTPGPDLVIPTVDRRGTTTDPQTLAISGTFNVELKNQGDQDVVDPFEVTVFEDSDGDGVFTAGVDNVLGQGEYVDPVPVGTSNWFTVPVAGNVLFRDNLIYAFADSQDVIAELDETNNYNNTGLACQVIESRTYTSDADFDEGVLFNANHDAPNNDQLQLNETATPFPFIWIALSGQGTVVKVDTVTGEVLGEYLSSPDGRGRNPSRTTVDLNGNVWVGNRDESWGGKGSVVHIGLEENFQCVDRNGNGVIDTSTGLDDVRAWPNTGGADNDGGVSTAEDECIIHYTRVTGTGTRTVAIDANNDVWVGGTGDRDHEKIAGATGEPIPGTQFNAGCGGYGGLVDGNGVLWSARPLLRYDPATDTATCLNVSNSYGLGIDSQGDIWNSRWSDAMITKLSPDGSILDEFSTGGSFSRGVTVTADDHIWVANSGSDTVTRLDNDGNLLATIPVGDEPTGVSVDAAGKVWVTNRYSNNAMRIDPATNSVDLTVDLGSGSIPYNYSDMTGFVALGSTAPQGTWTVIYDSGRAGTPWGTVSWTSSEPAGSTVTARARSAETIAGLGGATYIDASNGVDIDPPDGRYLQIQVKLTPGDGGASPIVYDVTVETGPVGVPDLTASRLLMDTGNLPDSVTLAARIGNGGAYLAEPGLSVAFYDGDPAAGGTLLGTVSTTQILNPGEFEDVTFTWTSPPAGTHDIYVVADDDGTGTGTQNECDETNNVHWFTVRIGVKPGSIFAAIPVNLDNPSLQGDYVYVKDRTGGTTWCGHSVDMYYGLVEDPTAGINYRSDVYSDPTIEPPRFLPNGWYRVVWELALPPDLCDKAPPLVLVELAPSVAPSSTLYIATNTESGYTSAGTTCAVLDPPGPGQSVTWGLPLDNLMDSAFRTHINLDTLTRFPDAQLSFAFRENGSAAASLTLSGDSVIANNLVEGIDYEFLPLPPPPPPLGGPFSSLGLDEELQQYGLGGISDQLKFNLRSIGQRGASDSTWNLDISWSSPGGDPTYVCTEVLFKAYEYVLYSPQFSSALVPVTIDVRPGIDPNTINLGSQGTVPVAVFSTADFDATTVDPESLTLAGAGVATGPDGTPLVSEEDVDGDGLADLVAQFEIQDLNLTQEDEWVILEGQTFEDIPFVGGDVVWVNADHFLCYKAKTTERTPKFEPRDVTLADQFETGRFKVEKPASLCAPAEKNDEGIGDTDTHLESYKIKPAEDEDDEDHEEEPEPRTRVLVENQFGQLLVDILKPERLLVPSLKNRTEPVELPQPFDPPVDHFKCYKVELSEESEFPEGIQVTLDDQFTASPKLFDVKKPTRLCAPVDKNDEGIKKPDRHLMCYQVKPARGEPKHEKIRGIYVNNQFGPEQLDVEKEEELCVPSLKTVLE